MSFKRVVSVLAENLKLFWERITASRIATIYFAFTIFSCVAQVVFQAQAFSINAQADNFLSGLIRTGNLSLPPGFFVLDSKLRFCDHVPNSLSTKSCQIVWDGEIDGTRNTTSASGSGSRTNSTNTDTSFTPIATIPRLPSTTVVHTTLTLDSTPTATAHALTDSHPNKRSQSIEIHGKNITLNNRCLVVLKWPVQTLKNTKREDVTFLAFQFWVLGMSIVALLNESIPHITAAVLTHLSATAWSGFQIYATKAFHRDFKMLTTDGACHVNLLPSYWSSRSHAEIPSLAFNVAGLLLSCFLSFRLIKLFGWQTFKRVGASRTINGIYKLILTLSTVIQLSLFFVVAAVILWLDQLCNGAIAIMASKSTLYRAMMTAVIILLIPWLLTGWFAARLEWKVPMMVFLVLSALYLVGLGLMFDSKTFRWTFIQWGFFGAMLSVSALLVLIGLIVGIICRLNFDKGLIHYLNAEEPIREGSFVQSDPGEDDFSEEKFDFPSTHRPIPTFSATFGSNDRVLLSDQMGPRFFNQSAVPFNPPVDIESATNSSVEHPTPPRPVYPGPTRSLTRHITENSTSSQASSTVSMNAPSIGRSRWVIE
jgi:hypothetical protein